MSHCTAFVGHIFPGNQLFFSQCTKQHQTNKCSSDSQVGRQSFDISLVAIVSEWSFCVEWCVWKLCVVSAGVT